MPGLALLILIFYASEFRGTVISVVDGDTIEVLKNGNPVRIRLNGIDCPEKLQAYGTKAKHFISDLLFGKTVIVKKKEVDRYGRTIADVYLEDGTWINKSLIQNGLAWHYKRYSSDKELAEAEINARKEKIGLWQDTNPVEPWNFRKGNK